MSKRSALLADISLAESSAITSPRSRGAEQMSIFHAQIYPNPDQPRKTFDDEALHLLAADMSENGQLQPIRVMAPDASGRHRIIIGERRWRAAGLAGLAVLDCVVDYDVVDDDRAFDLAVIENVQRQDLSRPELAAALSRIKVRFALSNRQIAQRYRMSEEWVAQHLAFSELAPAAQALMEEHQLATALAKPVRALPADVQAAAVDDIAILDNRTEQMARLTAVRSLQESGLDIDAALRSPLALPAPAAPRTLRLVGRPQAPVPPLLSEDAADRDLHLSPLRLTLTDLLRQHRSIRVGDFVDTLVADLQRLRTASRDVPGGERMWAMLTARLQAVAETD